METTLKMFNQKEVAQLFGTTRQTISLFRKKGILRSTKIGRKYMFSYEELKDFKPKILIKNSKIKN